MATLPSLASLEQFQVRLGVTSLLDEYLEPTEPDGLRAQANLDDASALIRGEAKMVWVDEYGELVDDVPDIIVAITIAVASRAYKNPDGYSQATLGDASVSFSREGNAGLLYLTKSEKQAIRRASGQSGISSQPLEKEYELAPMSGNTEWVEVTNGGDPMPMGPL